MKVNKNMHTRRAMNKLKAYNEKPKTETQTVQDYQVYYRIIRFDFKLSLGMHGTMDTLCGSRQLQL